jgi:hypothetical protein
VSRTAPNLHEVYQRDDGLWSIGFDDDAAGPFESREFALSVAGESSRKIKLKEARRAGSSP